MGENSILAVDHLSTPESLQSTQGIQTTEESSSSRTLLASGSFPTADGKKDEDMGEDEPLIQSVECRICQEEDNIKNLEIPCACNGSLKFAHRECVQRWCNEKGDITCEICHQPYQPNYTAPPPAHPNDTAIDISDDWTLAGGPYDLRDPRLLVMAEAERRLLEADYDEYNDSGANGAAFCRSAALILMALLLLRHALTIGNGDEDDDDVSTFFSLFLLRAAGFLLPCYIMAWAISILQRRRQREEATTRAAADVAFLLQAGQHRGIQVRIAQVARPGTGSAPAGVPVPPATEEHVVNVPVS